MAKTNFKYDVAISLCKQDVEFASKLVKAINPTLNVFFYEHKQEELINKSGPEAFAKIFKEESRIVVILSRNEWGNSFYTDIERNAIIDRYKNGGLSFLMIIPMVQGETPIWYPETRIYVSPFRFSIEALARFIEFKVAEQGGVVKTLTVEDRYQNLLDRINEKKSIIALQSSEIAIQSATNEIELLRKCFDEKINLFSQTETKNSIVNGIHVSKFNGGACANGQAGIIYGDFNLTCQIILPNDTIETTQDCILKINLFPVTHDMMHEEKRTPLETEERVFYYTNEFCGWAVMRLNEQPANDEYKILFQNRSFKCYDIAAPLGTETLIDKWFQKLLSKATKKIESHLK